MYMMHKESTIPFKIYANMPKQCPKRKKRKKKKKRIQYLNISSLSRGLL